MDANGIALIVSSITGLVAAVFAGYVAVKALPQVHTLVNRNFTEQKVEIERLQKLVETKNNDALAKAEAREAIAFSGKAESILEAVLPPKKAKS